MQIHDDRHRERARSESLHDIDNTVRVQSETIERDTSVLFEVFETSALEVLGAALWGILLFEADLIMVRSAGDMGRKRDRIERVNRELFRRRLSQEHLSLVARHAQRVPQESGVRQEQLGDPLGQQHGPELFVPNFGLLFQGWSVAKCFNFARETA